MKTNRSQLHIDLQNEWYDILRQMYMCKFVAMEYRITIKGKRFRFDVYGIDFKGNRYIVEIGTITEKKLRFLERYAKQEPKVKFFYIPYTEKQLEKLRFRHNIKRLKTDPPYARVFQEIPNPKLNHSIEKEVSLMVSKDVKSHKADLLLLATLFQIERDLKNPYTWQNIERLRERKEAIEKYLTEKFSLCITSKILRNP